MFDLPGGYDPDEEERRRQLLSGLVGGGITPNEAPAPTPAGAPTLQAPDTSFMQGPQGFGGYRPPPAAAPEYMDRVQSGHEFGMGDVAMLGGILAALLGGGKNGGAIAGALAGQYGQGVIGDMQQRNQRNAEIDQYNNKLANQNTEYDRWQQDMEAQLAYGNLEERKKAAALDAEREKRIREHQALLDDPNSDVSKGEVTQAERLARARSGVSIEEAQKRSDIELNQRKLLAELLGKHKGGGTAKAPTPKTPKQEFDDARYKKLLEDFTAGKINADGDPIDEKGNVIPKPKAGQGDGKLEPFADTEYENEALFNESASTGGNYQKNRQADADIVSGIAAFKTMEDLLKKHGSQWGNTEASTAITGEFDAAKGKVQAAYGVLKNLGVLQPTEAELIDKAIGADMGHGTSDVTNALGWGDLRVGKLSGARKAFEDALGRQRHAIGLRGKSAGGPAASQGSKATPGAGFSEAPVSSNTGSRTVTVTYTDGETEQIEADAAGIAKLKAHPDVRSVQ